jgi:hypothetical protein
MATDSHRVTHQAPGKKRLLRNMRLNRIFREWGFHAPDTLAVPVWETFAFAQLHHRKRLAGRAAGRFFCLFFWRFVLVYRRK